MATDTRIKYYPVGNGDTSLISLSDNTKIIIDINVTNEADDENAEHRFDVRSDLLNELRRDRNTPYTDVFILSHPDNDHCRGFASIFYTGDPNKYSDKDLENELIRIDELWFSPRVFVEYHKDLSEDAKAFKKEADRRIKLHEDVDSKRDEPGNRIRIIGYSGEADLDDVKEKITIPGNSINEINGSLKSDFSFFVHAPFKKDTDEQDDRNDTSIILQARFNVDGVDRAGLAFFGGDSGWEIWEKVLDKSKEDDLQWDLFLAPHHCSWTYFNESSDETKPKDSAIKILKKRREGAIIISSSKKIEDDDDNPPHFQAMKEYKKEVGAENFLVTATNPDENKPLPIEFRITSNGPQKNESKKNNSSSGSSLIGAATGKPKTYGR